MRERVAVVLSIAAVLSLLPSRVRAQKCPAPVLPSLDCTQTVNCCTTGAFNMDDVTALGGTWACGDAVLFERLTVPNNLCSQAAFDDHNLVFGVDTPTYAADGLDQCTASLPHPRHWMAGSFMIGAAIDWVPGLTWHHPIQDYLAASVARSNDIKPELEHVLTSGNTPNAQYTKDGVFADTIQFFCPLFSAGVVGTPTYRASDFIHEAWHSVYGDHDVVVTGVLGQDYYYPHDHVLGPGQVGDCFDPAFIPPGATGSFDCKVGTVPDFQTSVYQLQYEFLCDLVTTPQEWVPRSLAQQAGLISFRMGTSWFSGGQPVFLNTPPIFCNVNPPARDPRQFLPGRPRTVLLDVTGTLFEGATLPQDEDTLTLDEKDVLALEVSEAAPTASATWTSPAADEVWIEIRATATLQPDGDTVNLSYNIFFFEEDADNTNCDEDLTGDDCPSINDPASWLPLVLSTTSFVVPTFEKHLDNASNENGDDFAHVFLSFRLE
jgi:hypothetical protein